MILPITHYVTSLNAFVHDAPTKGKLYIENPDKDFTRNRMLPFSVLVWLQMSLLKLTLASELYNLFCVKLDLILGPTKSALCQARQKIKTQFFIDFFKLTSSKFYENFEVEKWNGLALYAVDGTTTRLPKLKKIGELMGWSTNQHTKVPTTRLLAVFDVMGKIIVDAKLFKPNESEEKTAHNMISGFDKLGCYLYDRGFGHQITLALHLHYKVHTVVRLKLGTDLVKGFLARGLNDEIITQKVNSDTYRNFKRLGLSNRNFQFIKFRLIKVLLDNGEIEVLATTLLDQVIYPASDFKKLYNQRWGIETCFFVLKSYMQLLNFSTFTASGCTKEIFIALSFYNIQSAVIFSARPAVEEMNNRPSQKTKEPRKHKLQINRNVCVRFLKDLMFGLCKETFDIDRLLEKLKKNMLRHMEPVRAERVHDKTRNPGTFNKGRHGTQTNYRRF